MVQILEDQPSFAQQLGRGAGNVIGGFATTAFESAINKRKAQKEQKELNSFADKIEKYYPDSPMHKTIADLYRSNLPLDQKSEIVKGLTGIDPFKQDQQERLKKEAIRTKYNQRIKEAEWDYDHLKTRKEKPAYRAFIENLKSERDQFLGFENIQEEGIENLEEEEKPKKEKFNPKNPEHKAKAQQLFDKLKDKKKVREVLEKEFEF